MSATEDTLMSAMLEILEPQVRDAIEADNLESIRDLLNDQHSADLADVLERLDHDTLYRVFQLLTPDLQAEVLTDISSEDARELLLRLPTEVVGDLLDDLPMDEVAIILTDDVPERQEELLAAMEPEDAAEVSRILQYPPQSAGAMMTERFVRLTQDMTAAQILDHLRQVDDEVETVTDLYVLNGARGDRLIGVVSLREVLRQPPTSRLADFMQTDVVSVPPTMDQEQVAQLVSRYDFLAMPVVDETGKMLGIITVDDIIDVLVEEGTEDALRFAGVESGGALDQPYFTVGIPTVIRRRVGWLLLLFVAETFTGAVLRLFESELAQVVALSFYIPLLIGTGGNTGAQTVSTIIRALALREIRLRDTWRVIVRELSSGLLLGLVLGTFGFLRSLLWGNDMTFSLVVGLSVLVICAWANTIGSLIPLIASRLRIDPAIVSAPLITTLVDATGLFIYLNIARLLLGL
jgi:magnesium transporter